LAFANLKNSDYFTHVWSAGQPVKVKEATGFAAHLAGDKLVYDFVVPLARPVDPKAGPLRIGIWDDSYYVDVGPAAGTTAHLDGTGAAGCKAAVIEDHDHPLYFGSIFPQTVQITC
jgi:tRNA threonylcarbamoyladenosine biosynthesis protein TsaE